MRKNFAFTLAEVLITITIIGVVAAMTIPNLVQDYQKKSWNTASEVFEARLLQALKIMNVQGNLTYYDSTEAFVNELAKNIKINKICESDNLKNCFIDKVNTDILDVATWETTGIISIPTTAENFGHKDWQTNVIGLNFADGVTGLIIYNPACKPDRYSNNADVLSCVSLIYDTSGFKTPNALNKDVKTINFEIENCYAKLNGKCLSELVLTQAIAPDDCQKLIDSGEATDIACQYKKNGIYLYKTCKDKQMRPVNNSEIRIIAQYLYNNKSLSNRNDKQTLKSENLVGIFEKLSNLTTFFMMEGGSNFSKLTTKPTTSNDYCGRYFQKSGTTNEGCWVYSSNVYGVCVKD